MSSSRGGRNNAIAESCLTRIFRFYHPPCTVYQFPLSIEYFCSSSGRNNACRRYAVARENAIPRTEEDLLDTEACRCIARPRFFVLADRERANNRSGRVTVDHPLWGTDYAILSILDTRRITGWNNSTHDGLNLIQKRRPASQERGRLLLEFYAISQ